MAELKTYTCDQCGVQKKDANHWFKLFTAKGLPERIGVSSWNPPAMDEVYRHNTRMNEIELHACGEECLQKLISKNLK